MNIYGTRFIIIFIIFFFISPFLCNAKSMVYFDNDAATPIRIHMVNAMESGTETRTNDRLIMPHQRGNQILNLSRKVGSGTVESSFTIAFSPQIEEIETLQKAGTPFDLDDFLWIPIAILYQWSKHGPFGGSIYYNIVYPEEKNNTFKEEKRKLVRVKRVQRGDTLYTFTIVAVREEPGGGQNDNIRFIISVDQKKSENQPANQPK